MGGDIHADVVSHRQKGEYLVVYAGEYIVQGMVYLFDDYHISNTLAISRYSFASISCCGESC